MIFFCNGNLVIFEQMIFVELSRTIFLDISIVLCYYITINNLEDAQIFKLFQKIYSNVFIFLNFSFVLLNLISKF